MSKRVLGLLVGVAIFSALVVSGPVPASAEVKLTYSNFFPPTHIQSKLAAAWCKEVEKRTNGEVKIQYFPGQTLTKAKQVYDGVVQGLSDVGMSLFAYTRGRFPLMACVELPLGYPNGVVATKVVNAVADKFKPKELSDVKVMYLHAHGPGLLFTRKKAVKSMADIKGLKIRSTGYVANLVKALGATPVAMPMPDLYQSLQKGVVDGAFYPMETNKGWKMADVVDYGTESYSVAYSLTFFVVMNKDKWNALSPAAKKAIDAINKEWVIKHGEAWDETDAAGKAWFLKKGNKLIKLSAAESAAWKKAAQPVLQKYIDQTSAKGLPAKEAVEFTVKTLAEMSK